MTMELSFYTSSPDETGSWGGVTKAGYDVSNTTTYQGMGVVAADTSVLEMYSIVHIEGLGKYIVLDTGSKIIGNKLDVLVKTKQEAIQRGRYNEQIKIIRHGKG